VIAKHLAVKIIVVGFVVALSGVVTLPLADVNVSVGENCRSFTINNKTSGQYRLGGIRFYDRHSYWTGAANSEGSGWTMFHQTTAGRIQQDLYFTSIGQSIAAPAGAKLVPGAAALFNRTWTADIDTAYPDMYTLLRTGSPGIPDDPVDAKPLTLTQLDSVRADSTFYDSSYRYDYYDSLGVNGGAYSGGFIDTWFNQRVRKAETQIQFPVPGSKFLVNGISVNFLPSGYNFYWMTIALCQEYFHADMQWMAALGAKETGIGTSFLITPANQKGIYGYWPVASASGLDRALSYPAFFPKYSSQLAATVNGSPSSVNADAFLTYYTRGNRGQTPYNSALMLNSCLMSALFQYVNYDICAYSTDICWKNSLATAVDRSMGASFVALLYNMGASLQVNKIVAILNPNKFQETCANPAAGSLIGTGNFNYVPDILAIAQAEVDASRQFEKNDSALTLVDIQITERELMDIFFGDTGTVAKQGNGGLLLHFGDSATAGGTALRVKLWNTLDTAFNKLKGKAPSASATTISFRYDFLSLVRTVKDRFQFIRQQPGGGEAALLISNYSGNYPSCSGDSADEIYPYLTMYQDFQSPGDVTIIDTVSDNATVKELRWSLDNTWKVWNKAAAIDSSKAKKKVYRFVAAKAYIASWRDSATDSLSGKYVWIMTSDSSGNSTIGRYLLLDHTPVLHPVASRPEALSIVKSGHFIEVNLAAAATLGWSVYDMAGHRVAVEREKLCPAGKYRIRFPALAQGVYMVNVSSAGRSIRTMKFIR
jgi:hypothetical protein